MNTKSNILIYAFSILLFLSGCRSAIKDPALREQASILLEEPEPMPKTTSLLGEEQTFLKVYPEPGATISLSSQDEWHFIPAEQEPGDVCFALQIAPLLREGDYIEVYENFELAIDGEMLSPDEAKGIVINSLVEIGDSQGNGNPIASGASANFFCWPTSLPTGVHLAELKVWTSNDEEYRYRWAFKIVR